jgi:hypothetical protein
MLADNAAETPAPTNPPKTPPTIFAMLSDIITEPVIQVDAAEAAAAPAIAGRAAGISTFR